VAVTIPAIFVTGLRNAAALNISVEYQMKDLAKSKDSEENDDDDPLPPTWVLTNEVSGQEPPVAASHNPYTIGIHHWRALIQHRLGGVIHIAHILCTNMSRQAGES